MASSTTLKARATHYVVGREEGEPLKIIYFQNILKGLKDYFYLNKTYVPIMPENTIDCLLNYFSSRTVHSNHSSPRFITTYTLDRGCFTKECQGPMEGATYTPLNILDFKGNKYPIKSITSQQRCDDCGKTYSKIHKCNIRRRNFYHHAVLPDSKIWWKRVTFTPVGCLPNVKRLYVVYDIETYTKHSQYGKQLVPYLLVFQLIGSKTLQNIASKIAIESGFAPRNDCFILLNSQSDVIGHHFKTFRSILQKTLALKMFQRYQKAYNINADTYADIESLNKQKLLDKSVTPKYAEIIIIGHNISGFDEIILASHVMEGVRKDDDLQMFKIVRSFMPRAGKLLFNDIIFSLPNPSYQKPDNTTFSRWKYGDIQPCDLKWQGLKFLVRDTFLLTHCSLRNAASAYQLELTKGHCPYNAINQYFMIGKYDCNEQGYPALKYWANEQEYEENKPKTGEEYNLIEEATKYCIEDVKVTARLVEKLIIGYQTFCHDNLNLNCLFNVFQRPTISSTTHAIFKQMFYKEEPKLSKFLPNLEAPSLAMYDHIRQSVRGGRCYPSFLGVYTQPIYVYDVCGMYASALSHPMPYGQTEGPFDAALSIQAFQHKLDSKENLSYFDPDIKPMIVVADCHPPDLDQLDVLPPLCSRTSGRLCWTNESLTGETLTTVDLIILHNRKWTCKIIQKHNLYAVWPEWKPLCRPYVTINIAAKERADKDKNQTQRSISKLLSNALYGSFATKLDNKKVVFMEDLDQITAQSLQNGGSNIISLTTVVNKSLPQLDSSYWKQYFDLPQVEEPLSHEVNDKTKVTAFIGGDNQDHVTFKPITFLTAECDNLLLATVEANSEWIPNDRYATQIASFVLAWSRAFMSEWATILYEDDLGKPYEERVVKSVYGDTDSLFVTEAGHKLMQTKGAHRLKSSKNPLVYQDGGNLTWLVECETVCRSCGSDAYVSESCFLAPKLYALQKIVCPKCGTESEGKLRAKGHAKECVTYDLLKSCFLDYYLLEKPTKSFQSERVSIKRTLISAAGGTSKPFTVVEKVLTRILRPWTDLTMARGPELELGYLLYPYDKSRPNPRPREVLTENPFWDDSS